ncbi:MAG: formate/nitrite transporter family protein [Butyrivibrio sp.]|nr:formate/nitrite transporter family protein [Butyrivibrio sp.]
MNYLKIFVSAILAGACIAFGGVAFLSVDSKVLGSALFTIGLFTVCTFGLHLFTGKVCYTFQNDVKYAISLPVIWLGNLVGTGIIANIVKLTRVAGISEKAMALCEVKFSDSYISLFILGILCNIFIYIGVEGYLRNPHEVGKYLSLFFGVMVFILCGTEHCIADMFYLWMAGAWSVKAIVVLLVITLGNCVGGVIFPVVRKYLS